MGEEEEGGWVCERGRGGRLGKGKRKRRGRVREGAW